MWCGDTACEYVLQSLSGIACLVLNSFISLSLFASCSCFPHCLASISLLACLRVQANAQELAFLASLMLQFPRVAIMNDVFLCASVRSRNDVVWISSVSSHSGYMWPHSVSIPACLAQSTLSLPTPFIFTPPNISPQPIQYLSRASAFNSLIVLVVRLVFLMSSMSASCRSILDWCMYCMLGLCTRANVWSMRCPLDLCFDSCSPTPTPALYVCVARDDSEQWQASSR